MTYVERDGTGGVKGVYAVLQPGIAEELLPDDDPEIVAYRTPPAPPPDPNVALDAAIDGAVNLADLKRALRGKITAR